MGRVSRGFTNYGIITQTRKLGNSAARLFMIKKKTNKANRYIFVSEKSYEKLKFAVKVWRYLISLFSHLEFCFILHCL